MHPYLYLSFLPDAYYPYYAVVFLSFAFVARRVGAPTGATFFFMAVVSYSLHLKFSLERLLNSLLLAGVGVWIMRSESFAAYDPGHFLWIFAYAFPACVHNVSALNEVSETTPRVLALAALVLAAGCLPHAAPAAAVCRHPEAFTVIAAHLAMCVLAVSPSSLALAFPAQTAWVLRTARARDAETDMERVADRNYQKYRRETSLLLPMPPALYARLPLLLKLGLCERV